VRATARGGFNYIRSLVWASTLVKPAGDDRWARSLCSKLARFYFIITYYNNILPLYFTIIFGSLCSSLSLLTGSMKSFPCTVYGTIEIEGGRLDAFNRRIPILIFLIQLSTRNYYYLPYCCCPRSVTEFSPGKVLYQHVSIYLHAGMFVRGQ
jgi:hypothetical protein